MSLALAADELTLARGERLLTAAACLRIGPGQIALLSGANGSGKTSLLRALAGLLRPVRGYAGIQESGAWLDRTDSATRLHLISHRDAITPGQTLARQLAFFEGWLGAPPGGAAAAAHALGLGAALDVPGRGLSAGQRRRAALARLVMVPRPVWLLDEPQSGLDNTGRSLLAALLERHRADGGIALIASHEEPDFAPDMRLDTASFGVGRP